MHEGGWWRGSRFMRPAKYYTASTCLGAPVMMPEDTRRSRTYTHRGMREQVSGSLGRPGKKCPSSASQLQPGPWAAGIQHSILESLPLPSAHLIRLMLHSHTAGQSLSQDASLFPSNAKTSLFLPVLKHTVLASVCSWKCQVRSLWYCESLILKRPFFKVCLPCWTKLCSTPPTPPSWTKCYAPVTKTMKIKHLSW